MEKGERQFARARARARERMVFADRANPSRALQKHFASIPIPILGVSLNSAPPLVIQRAESYLDLRRLSESVFRSNAISNHPISGSHYARGKKPRKSLARLRFREIIADSIFHVDIV